MKFCKIGTTTSRIPDWLMCAIGMGTWCCTLRSSVELIIAKGCTFPTVESVMDDPKGSSPGDFRCFTRTRFVMVPPTLQQRVWYQTYINLYYKNWSGLNILGHIFVFIFIIKQSIILLIILNTITLLNICIYIYIFFNNF